MRLLEQLGQPALFFFCGLLETLYAAVLPHHLLGRLTVAQTWLEPSDPAPALALLNLRCVRY